MKTNNKADTAKDLEARLYTHQDAPKLEDVSLYMPDGTHPEAKGKWDKISAYWKEMQPKNLFERTTQIVFPTEYTLWKMPPEVHAYVNKLLEYASGVATRVGPVHVKIAAGLTYAISEAVYGLKTSSGKKTASGLVGIIHHLREHADEKMDKWLGGAEYVVDKYFSRFDPKYA